MTRRLAIHPTLDGRTIVQDFGDDVDEFDRDLEIGGMRAIGGCPCCGSAYRLRGCTFSFGCTCEYTPKCPDNPDKCNLDCGHPEHSPFYVPPTPPPEPPARRIRL